MTNAPLAFALNQWPRRTFVLVCIGVFCVLSFFIYGLTLPKEFITLNDANLVYQNPIVLTISPATIKDAFSQYDPELYIPLTYLSYQFDWWLGHGSAWVFHLDNLLLHTINGLLIVWLMTLLSRRRWLGVLCGLVFFAHPISTEAVMWVSARKDLLSTFFGRSALIAYFYYLQRQRKGFLYGSAGLFLLALLTKVKVILLPLLMLLIDWKECRKLSWRLLIEKIPHFCFSVLFGIIAINGKQDLLAASSLSSKIFLGVMSMFFYLQHLVFPVDFTVYYPYLKPASFLSPDFLLSLVVLVLIAAAAIRSLRKTREVFFGLAMYVVSIAPSFANLAKGGTLFLGSDRYGYTALVGITYALGSAVVLWMESKTQRVHKRIADVLLMGSALLIVGLSVLSYRQSLYWSDSSTLYAHGIAVYPDYYLSYYDIGVDNDARGKMEEAIAAYQKAIALSPSYPLAHLNLGRDFYQSGRRAEARKQFTESLKENSNFAMPFFNLAVMDSEDGKSADAAHEYQAAIHIDPSFMEARLNLAHLREETGDYQRAILGLKKAFALEPDNQQAWALLKLFIQKGIVGADQLP